MLVKTRRLLLLITLYVSNILTAQVNPISEVYVEQFQNWVADSTETVDDSLVVSLLSVTFAELDPAAMIHIQSGSAAGIMDGIDLEYNIIFLKNSFLLRNAAGSFCSQLVGNKMNLVFSASPADESKYEYWRLWLEIPGGSTSGVVTYQVR